MIRLDERVYDLTRDLGVAMTGRGTSLTKKVEERIIVHKTRSNSPLTYSAISLCPHAVTHIDLPLALLERKELSPEETLRAKRKTVEKWVQPVIFEDAVIIDVSEKRKCVAEYLKQSSLRDWGLLDPDKITATEYREMCLELEIANFDFVQKRKISIDGRALLLYTGCSDEFTGFWEPHLLNHPLFDSWHVAFLHPYLSKEVVEQLLRKSKISFIGTDALGLDAFYCFQNPLVHFRPAYIELSRLKRTRRQVAHELFLKSDVPMLESWQCNDPSLKSLLLQKGYLLGKLLVVPLGFPEVLDALLVKLLFQPEE